MGSKSIAFLSPQQSKESAPQEPFGKEDVFKQKEAKHYFISGYFIKGAPFYFIMQQYKLRML